MRLYELNEIMKKFPWYDDAQPRLLTSGSLDAHLQLFIFLKFPGNSPVLLKLELTVYDRSMSIFSEHSKTKPKNSVDWTKAARLPSVPWFLWP